MKKMTLLAGVRNPRVQVLDDLRLQRARSAVFFSSTGTRMVKSHRVYRL